VIERSEPTLWELANRRAEQHPSAIFVVTRHEQVTYGQFTADVQRRAEIFRTAGIEPDESVLLVAGNDVTFLVDWFALIALGAVTVPVNPDLVGPGLDALVSDSGARFAVGSVADVRRQLEQHLRDGHLSLPGEGQPPRPASIGAEPQPGSAATSILFTSGSTGRAKGVVLTNRAYVASGAVVRDALVLTADDRVLVCLPLFHANPQFYAVAGALSCGASIALVDRFSASDFWSSAAELGATGFTYVGTILTILASTAGPDVPHRLRFCVGGGAPVAAWQRLEDEWGIRVHELYGMTETAGLATINSDLHHRRGTCGRPRPDVEVAVLDEQDRRVAGDAVGEIAIRSREPDRIFREYLRRPDLTVQSTRNLWFHTGDRGAIDADGYLHFKGRAGLTIRRGGQNISPEEVEVAILTHPSVTEVAVAAVADVVMGDEVHATVVVHGGDTLDPRGLAEHLRNLIPRYAIPRYVTIATSIPKTPTEKIAYQRLRTLQTETVDLKDRRSTGAST